MNENINLAEILKDAPIRTKLWSPICGDVELAYINVYEEFSIGTLDSNLSTFKFTKEGKYHEGGECLLFPSKDNRDWSTFKAPWKHKHFEPYQKVLISHFIDNFPSEEIWVPSLYSYYDKKEEVHILIDSSLRDDDEIIPYEGNEDKLGKSVE